MNNEEFQKKIKKNASLKDFPCLREKKLVDQCYDRTGYNREACTVPIENYKTCKRFWGEVEVARKRAGVSPSKPDAEERERIKVYFRNHKKIPDFQKAT